MKQMKYLFVAMICLMVSVSCAVDKVIPVEQLPASVTAFMQTYFPTKKIIYAEKDGSSIECRLDDGAKMEFNKKGEWTKVDCHNAAVPEDIVPAAIKNYVKSNFPTASITQIEKERRGYDVELSNKLDLKFSPEGALKKMDD